MASSTGTHTTPHASDLVVIGLSGGVDSAVSAALLKQAGYRLHGVVLRLWHSEPVEIGERVEAGRQVADALAIPYEVLDLREEFYERIVLPFGVVYAAGRTPNPCVMCNPVLKLAALLKVADRVGAQSIATGHYARVIHKDTGVSALYVAKASAKDQSYALYRLTQSILTRLVLPLGEVGSKDEVRALAAELRLPSADRSDSQDLCFVRTGRHGVLLTAMHPEACRRGPILTEGGDIVGEHSGIARFTVGQRGGLRISASQRLYVIDIDPARNAVVVGPRTGLRCGSCELESVTFCAGSAPSQAFHTTGRVRYRAGLLPMIVTLHNDDRAGVQFPESQAEVTPGQSIVFYSGDEVLGGGIVSRRSRADEQG